MAGIKATIEIRILDIAEAKDLFAAAEKELTSCHETLVELDEWLRSDPEYCPLCGASFKGCDDHEPDCNLANLTGDQAPE